MTKNHAAALPLFLALVSQLAFGQLPWMNTSLSAEQRTDLLLLRDDP